MKEIETLVEEKTKESLDVSRLTREGERTELGPPAAVVEAVRQVSPTPPGSTKLMVGQPQELSQHGSGLTLVSVSFLTCQQDFHLERALRIGIWLGNKTPVSQQHWFSSLQ